MAALCDHLGTADATATRAFAPPQKRASSRSFQSATSPRFWGKAEKSGKWGKASAAEPSALIRKRSPGCIQCFLWLFFRAVFPLCSSQCQSVVLFFYFGQRVSASFQRARSILLEKDEDAHPHLYIHSILLLHVCAGEKQS